MDKGKVINDIICQVLVDFKSRELIYSILNEFIPDYRPLNPDYAGKLDNKHYEFESENEMITYYVETINVEQTFYWNQYYDNPDKIMVGVNVTNDNQIVFSLTFNGNSETATRYFLQLKKALSSNIGTISYTQPTHYNNGEDFREKFERS